MTRPAPGGLAAPGFHGAGGIAGALQDPAGLLCFQGCLQGVLGFIASLLGLWSDFSRVHGYRTGSIISKGFLQGQYRVVERAVFLFGRLH